MTTPTPVLCAYCEGRLKPVARKGLAVDGWAHEDPSDSFHTGFHMALAQPPRPEPTDAEDTQ